MNALTKYISIHHAMAATFGSAIVCASVAAETGIRGVYDVFKLLSLKPENTREIEATRYNISANFGSALFYGICATNILPGSAILGAGIFAIYSNCVTDSKKSLKDEYLMSKLIGQPCHFVAKNIISPIAEDILFPVMQGISKCVYRILNKIPLPKHPIWIASAVLITAIAVAKLALPAIGIILI